MEAAACPRCGAPAPDGAARCPSCATMLGSDESGSPPSGARRPGWAALRRRHHPYRPVRRPTRSGPGCRPTPAPTRPQRTPAKGGRRSSRAPGAPGSSCWLALASSCWSWCRLPSWLGPCARHSEPRRSQPRPRRPRPQLAARPPNPACGRRTPSAGCHARPPRSQIRPSPAARWSWAPTARLPTGSQPCWSPPAPGRRSLLRRLRSSWRGTHLTVPRYVSALPA
jgi:hypothetical protein